MNTAYRMMEAPKYLKINSSSPKIALFSHVMELMIHFILLSCAARVCDPLYLDESIVNSTGKD